MITGSGLRHLTGGVETAREVKALVQTHIPFRLENGRFRPASMEEILQAKLDYETLSRGLRAAKTVNSMLDLIHHKIQVGKLEDASHLANKLQSLLPLRNSNLSERVEEVLKQLSEAYYIRADMRDRRGNYADAVCDYQTALSFDANNHEMLNSLAWLQSTCPNRETQDLPGALRNATKACELTNWKHWRYLSTLAIAYAQSGEFAEAVAYQQRALNLLPADIQDRWKVNFEQRLSLFQSHRSYDRKLFLHAPTENLIGWWKFDEAGGRIAMDASGNGHHGQVIGDPKWQPGKVGPCLRLDGSGDCINCGSDPAFNITDAVTLAVWIRIESPDENPQYATILGKGHNSWRIRSRRKGGVIFDCFGLDTGDASFDSIRSKKSVGDDHWHHIAGVYDGRRLLMYIDGNLDSSVTATGTTGPNESDLLIGGSWHGLIDDVRIYNRALSADEIIELYNNTK